MTLIRAFLSTLLFSCIATTSTFGQDSGFSCGANELDRMGHLIQGHPERLQEIAQAEHQLEQFTANWQGDASRGGGGYIIPVVFHIIHDNGPENISDDQVRDAILMMNQDFNQLTPDWQDVQPEFLPIVANVGVTFVLAQLDPDGNCTNGITRTVSDLTYEGGQDMKDLIDWPRSKYLNIWVSVYALGAAGYSMYPSSVSGSWGAPADGIVILHSYVGSIGTSSLNVSHALSHEAGHWMNLKHCWGDSNDPGLQSNCGMDDNVSDTPNTIGWTSCNLNGASCGSDKDNVENFMEYSYCSKMFTEGQKTRVTAALNSATASRNNLWTTSNLNATGVLLDPEICYVDLTSDRQMICAGGSVVFSDLSYNGVEDRTWTFQGGTPSVSNAAAPSITYDVPGTYDVTLTVASGGQSEEVTKTQYIVVLPTQGLPIPFTEGFEDGQSLPSDNWTTYDPDQNGGFESSALAGSSGSHSVKLPNTSSNAGNTDELISTTIDLSTASSAVLSFRYAFAKRNSGNNDKLRVYVSRDCGVTWSLRRALDGESLVTAPTTNGTFVPTADQWGYQETASITGTYLVSDLRVKFQFESDGGNSLWLDDINIISGFSGIDEGDGTRAFDMHVAPNPAGDHAVLTAMLPNAGNTEVELLDVTGRVVASIGQQSLPAGEAKWELPVASLQSGIYLVRLRQHDDVQVLRFTKN